MPLPARPSEWRLVLAILAITAAVYVNTLGFAFVYDDHNQIENNPTIQSWRYLPAYFTSHVWFWSHKASTVLYYRPIFMTWLLLNYKLAGLNSAWWHFATVALHVVSTLLVYFLARALISDVWTSLLAALLFGIYPAHVEAVDWISAGTEPLFAVFFASAFLCYLRRSHGRSWQAASILLAALALLAKETGVVFPLSVFAYEWILQAAPRPRWSRLKTGAIAALPYALLVAAYLPIRMLALGTFASRLRVRSYWDVLCTWPVVVMFYLRHLVLPARLSAYYNLDLVTQPGFWNFVVPTFELLLAGILIWLMCRLSKRVAFFVVWLLLTLLPVLSLTVFGTGELIHDRYLYVPSMSFCVLLAMAVRQLKPRSMQMTAAVVLCAVCAWATIREGRYWADGVSLNERGLVIAPGNITAIQNLGVELMRRGRRDEAIPYFLQVAERYPGEEDNLFDLGLCYYQSGMLPEAEQYLRRAIQADPLDPRAHLFLGVTWGKQNRLEEAEREIRKSIALQRIPHGYQGYHLALADTLEMKGDFAGALQEFQLELDNDSASEPAAEGIVRIEARRPALPAR